MGSLSAGVSVGCLVVAAVLAAALCICNVLFLLNRALLSDAVTRVHRPPDPDQRMPVEFPALVVCNRLVLNRTALPIAPGRRDAVVQVASVLNRPTVDYTDQVPNLQVSDVEAGIILNSTVLPSLLYAPEAAIAGCSYSDNSTTCADRVSLYPTLYGLCWKIDTKQQAESYNSQLNIQFRFGSATYPANPPMMEMPGFEVFVLQNGFMDTTNPINIIPIGETKVELVKTTTRDGRIAEWLNEAEHLWDDTQILECVDKRVQAACQCSLMATLLVPNAQRAQSTCRRWSYAQCVHGVLQQYVAEAADQVAWPGWMRLANTSHCLPSPTRSHDTYTIQTSVVESPAMVQPNQFWAELTVHYRTLYVHTQAIEGAAPLLLYQISIGSWCVAFWSALWLLLAGVCATGYTSDGNKPGGRQQQRSTGNKRSHVHHHHDHHLQPDERNMACQTDQD